MARVPVIDSPCPIAGRPLPHGATDHCSVCERSVHNFDRLSARERVEFMSSCSGKVCVAYTVRIPVSTLRKRGLAAAAVIGTMAAAALVSLPVAADETDANQLPNCDDVLMEVVMTGGVVHTDQAEWVEDGKDAPPDLPSIEDDGK